MTFEILFVFFSTIFCIPNVCMNSGRPLELDTDGIWCIMPASFPENYDIR